MDRNYFVEKIKEVTNKEFKIRFFKKGKYGEPECWIYKKENNKREKLKFNGSQMIRIIDIYGKPIMESNSGILITLETLENKELLTEYIESCFN